MVELADDEQRVGADSLAQRHLALGRVERRTHFDKIAVGDVSRFEASMLGELRASKGGLLEAIRGKRELSADIEKELVTFLDKFAAGFA